jgi:hypothetical protein
MSEAIAVESSPWTLVPAHPKPNRDGHATLSKRPVLLAVARRGLPNIVEATIVPAILFRLLDPHARGASNRRA